MLRRRIDGFVPGAYSEMVLLCRAGKGTGLCLVLGMSCVPRLTVIKVNWLEKRLEVYYTDLCICIERCAQDMCGVGFYCSRSALAWYALGSSANLIASEGKPDSWACRQMQGKPKKERCLSVKTNARTAKELPACEMVEVDFMEKLPRSMFPCIWFAVQNLEMMVMLFTVILSKFGRMRWCGVYPFRAESGRLILDIKGSDILLGRLRFSFGS